MRIKFFLALLLMVLLVAGGFWYSGSGIKLTDKDVLLVGDFENSTGDAVFDGSLREAVSIGLAQSPLLNLVSAEKVAEAMRSRSLAANTPVDRALAPKLCGHVGATAFLTGAIAKDGDRYLLRLGAFQCASGKEMVVHALGDAAAKLRSQLGENSDSIEKFNLPLERATSSSAEAIQWFAEGRRISREKGSLEAVPALKKAVELDAKFALARS